MEISCRGLKLNHYAREEPIMKRLVKHLPPHLWRMKAKPLNLLKEANDTAMEGKKLKDKQRKGDFANVFVL